MASPLTDEKMKAARAWAEQYKVPWHLRAADGTRDTLSIADLVAEIDRLREEIERFNDDELVQSRNNWRAKVLELEAAIATAKREAEEAQRQADERKPYRDAADDRIAEFICEMLLKNDLLRSQLSAAEKHVEILNQSQETAAEKVESLLLKLSAAREAMAKVPHVFTDGVHLTLGGLTSRPHDTELCSRNGGQCAFAALRESKEKSDG